MLTHRVGQHDDALEVAKSSSNDGVFATLVCPSLANGVVLAQEENEFRVGI